MAQSASAKGYAPSDRPHLTVAGDGTLAAIREQARIVVVELPSCAAFGELGLDEAAEHDVAWVGTPPRLLVLSRYAEHSNIYLVDPFGPRTVAELRLDAPMQLAAFAGNFALAIGAPGAAVLAVTERGLTPFQFPARAIPTAAGAAGSHFMVAVPGGIEEWDPSNRLPKRRLKLPRPAQITALGGSDRVVWMTTQQEPSRVDVIPLVNRGQPKTHDLPEPIAHVAAHPRSDLIACIGANSGRIWVIDLDGRIGLRMVGPEGIDRVEAVGLVVGRSTGVLAAQATRPITVVPLERKDEEPAPEPSRTTTRDSDPPPVRADAPSVPRTKTRDSGPPSKPSTLYGDDSLEDDAPNTAVTLTPPQVTRTAAAPPPPAAPRAPAAAPPAPPAAWKPKAPAGLVRKQDDPTYAAFRERVHHGRARTAEPLPALWTDASPAWRDELAAWARSAIEGSVADVQLWSPIETTITRFDLTPSLAAPLALLYGAHLLGHDGVAPIALARIAGWHEALGRGELADKQLAAYARSRVRLALVVQRALDELRPLTGWLVGTPGAVSLLGPCVVVAAGPLPIVAEACGSSIGGAILAAHDSALPNELVLEARAYGAAPMLRITTDTLDRVPVDQPIILVADEPTAGQLGLPRLT